MKAVLSELLPLVLGREHGEAVVLEESEEVERGRWGLLSAA